MGAAYRITCVECNLDAPRLGDSGHIGLPSTATDQCDGMPSFGYLYLGFDAIKLLTGEIERFWSFLLDHEEHGVKLLSGGKEVEFRLRGARGESGEEDGEPGEEDDEEAYRHSEDEEESDLPEGLGEEEESYEGDYEEEDADSLGGEDEEGDEDEDEDEDDDEEEEDYDEDDYGEEDDDDDEDEDEEDEDEDEGFGDRDDWGGGEDDYRVFCFAGSRGRGKKKASGDLEDPSDWGSQDVQGFAASPKKGRRKSVREEPEFIRAHYALECPKCKASFRTRSADEIRSFEPFALTSQKIGLYLERVVKSLDAFRGAVPFSLEDLKAIGDFLSAHRTHRPQADLAPEE